MTTHFADRMVEFIFKTHKSMRLRPNYMCSVYTTVLISK